MSEYYFPVKDFIINKIADITSDDDFNQYAINIFNYQYSKNIIYKKYVDLLNININNVKVYKQIPFLPIQFFKNKKVLTQPETFEATFVSSGTTSVNKSHHYIKSLELYKTNVVRNFNNFFNNYNKSAFVGVIPQHLTKNQDGSSLLTMMKYLTEHTNNDDSFMFAANNESGFDRLMSLLKQKKKVILMGVTYNMLDLSEKAKTIVKKLNNLTVIETGGMKGKRIEIPQIEVHKILSKNFGTSNIFSEYGMTELMSQAYTVKKNLYKIPVWMRVLIRDIYNPFELKNNKRTGAINIIDLANIDSCCFIATDDIGRKHDKYHFEMLGRIDNSDLRGCNLLAY